MTPQQIAEACARIMWDADAASRALGMTIEAIAPGSATLTMTVTASMANGHGHCHGGYIFTLSDSAFAFACNSYNHLAVAQHTSISFLSPVRVGDRLTARAVEVARKGRSGLYDVGVVNRQGEQVAAFRGHSRQVPGTHLPETGTG